MKKILSILLLQLCVCCVIFGATINSKDGYFNLKWGSTIEEAKKAGYKLITITDKNYLSKLYSKNVIAYSVKNKEKSISTLQLHYYKGKLFAVIEHVDMQNVDKANLEKRYGKFSTQEIIKVGKQYMDAKVNPTGSVSFLSIMITPLANSVSTIICDWNVYKEVSLAGQALARGKQKTIVEELAPLAHRLVQEKFEDKKASFAFMPLMTDYKNTLVDNYITDALSEAMFNTGKIKIIERSYLEALLAEQKFQASGLVNEATAKSIGMIVGANYVCYGTLKDIEDSFSVTARIVDVETGEIVAMSRADIRKDDYLKKQVQSAIGSSLYTPITKPTTSSSKTQKKAATPEPVKTAPKVANNAWKVVKYRDDFGDFTQYVFTVNSTDEKMLFVSYKKCDNAANNRVIAGIHWENNDHYRLRSSYDIKGQTGSAVTKELKDAWKMYLDSSEKNHFYFVWNQKAGARWLVDIIRKSNSVAVRRDGLTRRFQTAGLLEKMAEYGITWAEIDAALANEEF